MHILVGEEVGLKPNCKSFLLTGADVDLMLCYSVFFKHASLIVNTLWGFRSFQKLIVRPLTSLLVMKLTNTDLPTAEEAARHMFTQMILESGKILLLTEVLGYSEKRINFVIVTMRFMISPFRSNFRYINIL